MLHRVAKAQFTRNACLVRRVSINVMSMCVRHCDQPVPEPTDGQRRCGCHWKLPKLPQHRRVGNACAHTKNRPKELPMDKLTSNHATATQRPRPPCFDSIPGDGFGVVCHHPACTGASPACRLLPSEESHSVLGDGASPIGHKASSASNRKALLSFPFHTA
jgi:hypothetical protein